MIIENDEVAVGDVEAGEVVDGGFGVVDVLVDDESGSASVLVGADADLANGAVFAKDVVHLLAGDVEGKVPNVQHAVHLRRKPRVPLPETYRRH